MIVADTEHGNAGIQSFALQPLAEPSIKSSAVEAPEKPIIKSSAEKTLKKPKPKQQKSGIKSTAPKTPKLKVVVALVQIG